ncbi:hypothetical protein [Prauserella muralis]|uniref:Uncharacterized protein n=1 Tax=Prauserella muralis TaxID=588067 RepID=A0A2V4AKP2_9PSEU|nr:hypothetical protein [Prauserella muralis]PXY20847.1 hypothetical protein BAY60_25420 [Prauserella muralis]TWE29884.1 hypothetical protein FHX69_2576 [Prauserella muralis]
MPNAPRTPTQNIRVDEDLWREAREVAEAMGTDRSSAVRAFLRWYVRRPGAELPERPGGPGGDGESAGARRALEEIDRAYQEFQRATAVAKSRIK